MNERFDYVQDQAVFIQVLIFPGTYLAMELPSLRAGVNLSSLSRVCFLLCFQGVFPPVAGLRLAFGGFGVVQS